MNEIKIGSLVRTKNHPYDKNIICQVDRLYNRMSGGRGGHPYCRLVYFYKGEYRMYNTSVSSCEIDRASFRDEIIDKILNNGNIQ